jgi:hypothetical protein
MPTFVFLGYTSIDAGDQMHFWHKPPDFCLQRPAVAVRFSQFFGSNVVGVATKNWVGISRYFGSPAAIGVVLPYRSSLVTIKVRNVSCMVDAIFADMSPCPCASTNRTPAVDTDYVAVPQPAPRRSSWRIDTLLPSRARSRASFSAIAHGRCPNYVLRHRRERFEKLF